MFVAFTISPNGLGIDEAAVTLDVLKQALVNVPARKKARKMGLTGTVMTRQRTKKPPLRTAQNPAGDWHLSDRGDRIRTCGILLPKRA